MKRLVVLFLLFAAIKVAGQTTGYLRFDTVRIYKQNGTCELYLINSTKDSLGQLTNVGGGLTRFIKPRVINDSTFTVGLDTLVLRGASGGSGGSGTDNANIGAGYRLLVPSSQEIKTLFPGYGVLIDSSSNANGITFKIDTSCANCPVTRSELIDSTDNITYTEKPIYVKSGSSDTLALAIDPAGGLDTNPADTSLRIADNGITTQRIADLNVTTGKIAANAITNAKLAQMPTLSAKVNATNSTADPQDIQAASDHQVLRRNGTALAFGAVNLASSNAVTGELPENNLQAFKPYPAEYVWKTIYEKRSWTDLSDFATLGTASISLSGGYVNVTASTEDYTPRVLFKPEWATGLNYWKKTVGIKIISFGTPSNWLGPFIKSLVNHDGANFGYQFFTGVGSGGGGNSFFTTENGSIISNPGAGSGVTKSVNDLLEMTMERIDTVLTFTLRNVTTSTTATPITYTFPANNTPNILPNVGQWGILLNAASGTFQIQYVKIESAEIIAPNVLVMGNSKTANGATTFSRRFPTQLNATYPTVTWSAGTAERMDPDMFYKKPELVFRNPEYVILASVYDNDIRAGFSAQDVIDDMIRLENYWKGGGTTVLWCSFPEDSTAGGATGLQNIRNWLVANRPNNYINTWDALRASGSDNRLSDTYDAGDGVHLNAAGHDVIVSTIIASGKLATISTNRRTAVRTKTMGSLGAIGDSIALPFEWRRVAGNIPKVNSAYDVTGSMIWDNGTNVVISSSMQPTSPLANAILAVNGPDVVYGNLGVRRTYDRVNTSNFYESYVNSNTLNTGYNGTDYFFMGTAGQIRIGPGSGISSTTMLSRLQLRGNWSFSNSSPGYSGQLLNVDTTTMTFSGATGIGDVAANSFAPVTLAATGTSNADTVSNVAILNAIADGNNMTSATKLSFYVRDGAAVIGGNLSILKRNLTLYATNETRHMLVVDTVTGHVDRMPIPSGGGISGLTAGRVTLSTGSTSIGDDGNLLYSTSNAGTLSVGTSATVGHVNIGGNRNFDGTGTSTGYGVGINSAATTYTDNVTSASGSTTFAQHLFAAPTLAASNSSITATAPMTARFEAPAAGTNVTITIPYSIAGFGGAVWFNGARKGPVTVGVHNNAVSYTDDFVTCDATSGNFNINLPSAATYSGIEFTFKRLDNSGNTCTVTASDNIDGSGTYSLSAQYKYVTVKSNGTTWLVKANN